MYKVVCNACYGGFSLSEEAFELLKERKGCTEDVGHYRFLEGIPRHDPDLIAVVEELGEKADGFCADLEVVEIDTPLYRINEYDGLESVETPNSESFILIDTQEKLEHVELD